MTGTSLKEKKTERPLDFLHESKGKEVIITLDGGDYIEGKLLAFDIHINLLVDHLNDKKEKKNLFIKGATVVFVEEK